MPCSDAQCQYGLTLNIPDVFVADQSPKMNSKGAETEQFSYFQSIMAFLQACQKCYPTPRGPPARRNVLTRRLRESMSGLCHNAASLELALEMWEGSRFRDGVPPRVGNMREPASTAPSYETDTREAWREW